MEGCLHHKVPYSTLSHPRGIVYEGTNNRKRLMRTDEIHKKWIQKDRERTQSIMEKIEKMLKERRSSDDTTSFDHTSYDDLSSSETTSDDTTKKPNITARKGPTKELFKWYDDIIDEDIAQFEVLAKSKDSRLKLRKSIIDNPFTLDSIEEVDNVRILQSCNGLLLCTGSGCVGLRMAFDPTKSLNYIVVHVGHTSYDIDIQIYSLKT
ncbi:hypothetical protein Tco_0359840, partial [Tanacetum coccineum]